MNLLILNQYFPPDRAATALLLGQLAEDLARHHPVRVICGTPTYDPETTTPPSGVQAVRVPLLPTSRKFLPFRILNYVLFLTGAFLRALLAPRPDALMCWTDPPILGFVCAALKRIRDVPLLLVSQDIHPEAAAAMGKLRGKWGFALLQCASRRMLRAADVVVAVGSDMARRLAAKGVPIHRIRVIPNWQDLSALKPADGARFRRESGIPDPTFLVMHSGNIGFSQDFDTLLAAASRTKEATDVVYLLVGEGGRKKELADRILKEGLGNVRILPYQPTSALSESLSAADLHYVSLRPELEGYIVPSKIYGILAVGRPVVAVLPPASEAARVVKDSGCGVNLPPDPSRLAELILAARKEREEWRRRGEAGRVWSEKNGGRDAAVKSYEEILRSVVHA